MDSDIEFDMLLEELNNPDSLSYIQPAPAAVSVTASTPGPANTQAGPSTAPVTILGQWRDPPVEPGMESDSSSSSHGGFETARDSSSTSDGSLAYHSARGSLSPTRLTPLGGTIHPGTTYLRPIGPPVVEQPTTLPHPSVSAEVYPDHDATIGLLPAVGAIPLAVGTAAGTVLPPIVEAAIGAGTALTAGAEAGRAVADLAQDVHAFGENLNALQRQAPAEQPLPAPLPPAADRLVLAPTTGNDSAIVDFPRRKRREIRQTVTIGDHSIVTEGITGMALVTDKLPPPTVVNFFRTMWNQVRNNDGSFGNADGHYNVTSRISSPDFGGGVEMAIDVELPAFWTLDEPLADANRATCTIVGGSPKALGHIDAAKIAAFMTGGVVSERFVVSAIQPKLQIANLNCARYLSDYLTAGLPYYDNYLIYAKLAYWAMVQDVTTAMVLQPVAVAFPAEAPPNFINLDDQNLNYLTIGNAMEAGNIMFVDRHDYSADDLQILMWLAKPGIRVSGPAQGLVPACTYVSWPAVPVTVLLHGVAPGLPAAQLVPSDSIYAFLARIAQYRGEWACLQKGLYTAMDLLGIRYTQQVGVDNDRFHFLLSSLNNNSPTLALPHDYNVLLRVLNLRPPIDEDAMAEALQFTTSTAALRVDICALYSASLSAMTTTVLHGLNVSTTCLVQWSTNDALLPPMAAFVISKFGAINVGTSLMEPMIYSYPKRAFTIIYGCSVQEDIYYQSPWLSRRGHGGAAGGVAYNGIILGQTPRLGNLLGIDNWILIRPMEWAISCPGAKVDIHREITSVGAAAGLGWRGVRGSTYYQESASGNFPGRIVTYGAQVMNAIVQDVRPAAGAVFTASAAAWTPGGVPEWAPPAPPPVAGILGEYVPLLHTYSPCSIMSYNYHQATTYAPALVGANLPNALLARLLSWRGQQIPRVGLFLRPQIADSPAGALGSALDDLAIFGGGGTSTHDTTALDAAGGFAVNPN